MSLLKAIPDKQNQPHFYPKTLFNGLPSVRSNFYHSEVYPEFIHSLPWVYPRVPLSWLAAGECGLTCFGVYPRCVLTCLSAGGRRLRICEYLRAYKAPHAGVEIHYNSFFTS